MTPQELYYHIRQIDIYGFVALDHLEDWAVTAYPFERCLAQ